jgi:ferrous iron transport protein B
MAKRLLIALTGNPNSGKTTVFNALTKAHQKVGNYPGVTVEKKEGICRWGEHRLRIVDLPGTYSLTGYSTEELVARHFLLDERPDVVVDVIDASNLERHLYLAVQLMEMNVPLVLAFNMSDIARRRGMEFDLAHLEVLLGAPIVPMTASQNEGIEDLLRVVTGYPDQPKRGPAPVRYGPEIEEELAKLEPLLDGKQEAVKKYGRRWLALKLLEGDTEIFDLVRDSELSAALEQSRKHLEAIFSDSPEIIIADRRYGFISGACMEAVKSTVQTRRDTSDKIDAVLTHPVLGLPIFALMMFLVFFVTFQVGQFPMQGLESLFALLTRGIYAVWPEGWLPWLRSLLADGVIGGVGGVIVFLPNILLLFLGIAFLEDTGYMARAAFIADRVMHRIGLHGKSFIPMLIGFGCSVPAIMATRILENRRNRLTTMLVIPLMSCGARITIYSMLIPAFFPEMWRGPMMWLIYVIGILLAVILATILRKTLLRGETIPFVMELPPYRMPTWRGLLIHMWDRGWMYLKKAGTTILLLSMILWALSSYPKPPEERLAGLSEARRQQFELEYSVTGRIGKALEPVFKPIGFDWKIVTAMVGATVAKEVFVSQLSIVYALGETGQDADALRMQLQADYTRMQGFCIMLFMLIAAPCVATVAVMKRESGAWGWAVLQFAGLTAIGWIVTFAVFQTGRLVSAVFL